MFVFLDGQNALRRDGLRGTFLTQSLVFAQSKTFKSAEALNAILLLVIALKPDLTIRMGGRNSLKERRRAIPMQIDSTDDIRNRIKRRPSRC